MYWRFVVAPLMCGVASVILLTASNVYSNPAAPQSPAGDVPHAATPSAPAVETPQVSFTPKPIPEFIDKGLAWLAATQFDNGGWGAGAQARQEIRDPRAVQIDPATTAFAAMALLRAGNTLTAGPYRQQISKALQYLLETVETSPEEGPKITNITGTQPQSKLGQHIDTSMCIQFFSRVLPHTHHDAQLMGRVTQALDKALGKLQRAQGQDGSWSGQAWAPVLQSSMANSALEMAQAAGRRVDEKALDKSRTYQKGNVDAKSGAVRTERAAGISLYALAGSQRATAQEAREAQRSVDEARAQKTVAADAEVSVDNLMQAGHAKDKAEALFEAYKQNDATRRMLRDDKVLAGFGNNGGEEYLSYMMTSESLVVTESKDWDEWYTTMGRRLGKVQNPDGSWSGHHCITSPVFSTAAVVLTMTADRDVQVLRSEQQRVSQKPN